MRSFKDFITEENKFDHDPHIGWWEDHDTVTLYHGTHEKNHESVMKNGINKKDPKTGRISLTLDPHTAHGYAAMSGEYHFRRAQGRPVSVPHEKRVVYKVQVKKDWLKKHMDHNLRGNIGIAKDKLNNRAAYDEHKKSGKPDHEYYRMTEFRVDTEIPSHAIVGHMRRHPVTN